MSAATREKKCATVEFAESFVKSAKQAVRIANGENLGAGAEEWLAGLRKEAEDMRDGN